MVADMEYTESFVGGEWLSLSKEDFKSCQVPFIGSS